MKSQLPFPLLFSTLAILLLCCGKTQAELITLYDATGLPGNQPWLGFAADTLSGWSQSTAPGGTQLTTNNTTRAGYSVILLGHDAKGIELGFWTNEIWAQKLRLYPRRKHSHRYHYRTQLPPSNPQRQLSTLRKQ